MRPFHPLRKQDIAHLLLLLQSLLPALSLIAPKIRHAVQTLKASPCALARVLRQPSTQYRIAFLLAMFLAVMLARTTFLSALPHPTLVAYTEYCS
jgi:hypothetical protein